MWISSPVFGASAHWNVIGRFADGILATRVWVTRVNTIVFYAGLVICTFIIVLTFSSFDFKIESKVFNIPLFWQRTAQILCWLTLYTASKRVSSKARWAPALCPVVLYKALSIGAAWVGSDTRIDTASKIASLIPRALFIWLATNRLGYDWWELKKKKELL